MRLWVHSRYAKAMGRRQSGIKGCRYRPRNPIRWPQQRERAWRVVDSRGATHVSSWVMWLSDSPLARFTEMVMAHTRMPQCREQITSGTMLMPTTSAPSICARQRLRANAGEQVMPFSPTFLSLPPALFPVPRVARSVCWRSRPHLKRTNLRWCLERRPEASKVHAFVQLHVRLHGAVLHHFAQPAVIPARGNGTTQPCQRREPGHDDQRATRDRCERQSCLPCGERTRSSGSGTECQWGRSVQSRGCGTGG